MRERERATERHIRETESERERERERYVEVKYFKVEDNIFTTCQDRASYYIDDNMYSDASSVVEAIHMARDRILVEMIYRRQRVTGHRD